MKLFGKKLNIIDLLILFVVLAAVVLVGIKLLGDDTETLGSESALTAPNLRATVLCEAIDPELAANLTAALEDEPMEIAGNLVERTRLFYSNKLVDGKITGYEIRDNGDGTADLLLDFEAVAVVSDGAYSVALQEVRIAKEFIVKTLDVEIEGVILSMERLG